MIEIEKKFQPTEDELRLLLADAQELGQKTVVDTYFDTSDYGLTSRDLWFRERDGLYELKAPLKSQGKSSSLTNQYHEITERDTISRELNLSMDVDFETAMALAGITQFMTCYTTRQSYDKHGFHIDVDTVTYADSVFRYALAEIELLIDDETQADDAEQRIVEFAKSFELTTGDVILGKVAAFLQAEKPKHYRTLVKSGILR